MYLQDLDEVQKLALRRNDLRKLRVAVAQGSPERNEMCFISDGCRYNLLVYIGRAEVVAPLLVLIDTEIKSVETAIHALGVNTAVKLPKN